MITPKGNLLKFQKLGGHRWRLECLDRKLVIEKCRDGTANLFYFSGDPIGKFPCWKDAKQAAIDYFDGNKGE